MTITSILGIFFIIELALVASVLAVYLFLQLKQFKRKLSAKTAEDNNNSAEAAAPSLHDLFDIQIIRTRKKLTEKLSTIGGEEHKKLHSLLSQRIEFLKFEKEILAETVTDQSYWKRVCEHIANVISISNPAAQETITTQTTSQGADDSTYKERIANYQQQLEDLRAEFDSHRKYSSKLASSLSSNNQDPTQETANNKLIADFKEHEKNLRARLNKSQQDNEALQRKTDAADCQSLIKEQKSNGGGLEMNVKTASEEEIKRLRDIINRQYSSIDELRSAATNSQSQSGDSQKVTDKLLAVEQSQQELKVCAEMLEIENQRLLQELETSRTQTKAAKISAEPALPKELFELRLETKKLNDQNKELEKELSVKDARIQEIIADHETLQKEFMQMYTQQEI